MYIYCKPAVCIPASRRKGSFVFWRRRWSLSRLHPRGSWEKSNFVEVAAVALICINKAKVCPTEGWLDCDASVLNGSTEQIKNFHFASHFEVHQTVSLPSEYEYTDSAAAVGSEDLI